MHRRTHWIVAALLAGLAACGSKGDGPVLPDSAHGIVFQTSRTAGTSVLGILPDGTIDLGRRKVEPGTLEGLESYLTALATSIGTQPPPAGTPTELALSENYLRMHVAADAPLSRVAAVTESVLRTTCELWPGSARVYFDLATPSIRSPRVFPVLVRAIAGKPGKSANHNYVALRITSAVALPEGFDAAKPLTLTITPNAGGGSKSEPRLGWDDVKQRIAAAGAPSEFLVDLPMLGTAKWSEVIAVLDQAFALKLDEVALRAAK